MNFKQKFKSARISKLMLVFVCSLFSYQAFAAHNLSEMFQETSVDGKIMYRFNNWQVNNSPDFSDSAIGGLLSAKTGSLDGVSFGVTFGTAHDAYSNDGDLSYGVLGDGHKGFNAMKEYYVQGEKFDTTIKYGAQMVSTPWANDDSYSFMLPNTFKGVSVVNKSISNTEIQGYYLTDMSGWFDSGFRNISSAVGSSVDDKPLVIGGIKYALPSESNDLRAEAWTYHMNDFLNNNFVRGTVGTHLGDLHVYLTPSYLQQKSTGDEIGGHFDTYQYGAVAGGDAYGFDFSLSYAKNGDDKIFRGWGNSLVSAAQFLMAERAEEKGTMAYAGYDFSNLGLAGLYAGLTYAIFDTPDSGVNASSDATEVDYNVMYDFNNSVFHGALNGLHLEVRYAQINYDDNPDQTELQAFATYSFSFGGKK